MIGDVAMLKEEMEKLREKINSMIVSEDTNSDDLLKESQKMDILIAEYLEKNIKMVNDEEKQDMEVIKDAISLPMRLS